MVRSRSPIQSRHRGYYEGIKARPEQESTTSTGQIQIWEIKVVVDDFVEPNGMPFRLTRRSSMSSTPASLTDQTTHGISVCSTRMLGPERCRTAKSLPKCQSPALPTGYAADTAGRIWCSVGWGDPSEDGVRCYTPEGELLARFTSRKLLPTCASAVSNEIDFTSVARAHSTQLHECAGRSEAMTGSESSR